MGHQAKNLSGKLDVAVTVTVAGYFISKPLTRFRRSFPNVEVTLHEYSRHVIEKKVAKGQLNVAVVLTSNVSREPYFETLTLFRSQRRLWLPASHSLNEVGTPTLKEVAEEPYIQLLIDEAGQTTQNYWKLYGLKPRVVFRTESVEAVRSLVGAGAGITILSDMVHRPWSLEGMPVETKPLYESIPTMDTGLIWNRTLPVNPLTQAFIDFCRMEYTSGQQ
jgi:DNA-binding transcriptional LysR family regulator